MSVTFQHTVSYNYRAFGIFATCLNEHSDGRSDTPVQGSAVVWEIRIVFVTGPSQPFLRCGGENIVRHGRCQLLGMEVLVDLVCRTHGHTNGSESGVRAERSRDNTVATNIQVGELPDLGVIVNNGFIDLVSGKRSLAVLLVGGPLLTHPWPMRTVPPR